MNLNVKLTSNWSARDWEVAASEISTFEQTGRGAVALREFYEVERKKCRDFLDKADTLSNPAHHEAALRAQGTLALLEKLLDHSYMGAGHYVTESRNELVNKAEAAKR